MRSKFAGVFEARKPEEELRPVAADPEPAALRSPQKQRGRPSGKRSSADHTQTTAYIRVETHRAIKRALLDDGRDFSELVEELLRKWLESRS